MGHDIVNGLSKIARAISTRLDRLSEVRDLRKHGKNFPSDMWRLIWKEPHELADYIDLSVFIDAEKPVTLLDVGANVGKFTSNFVKFFPKTSTYAFEPVPETFEMLRANVEQIAQLHQLALSDSSLPRQIWVDTNHTLSSLEQYRPIVNELYQMQYSRQIEIQCARLDDLEIGPLEEQVILKVDVQGHEVAMFNGAKETLRRVDVVLAELTFAPEYEDLAPSFPHVCDLLREADLYPIVFQDYGRSRSNYGFERDVVFAKRNLLDRIWR